YPFIQTGDVKHAPLYLSTYTKTYSEEGLKQSKLWKKGTLCITIAANIADTAILDIDACFPDSVIGFVANEEVCDTKFIKYTFNTLQQQYKQFSQGAAQDNLSLEKLLSIKFKIPSLPVQQKIAGILSAYDDLIDNNRKRIALLEKAARLLYEEWFVRLQFPGHEHTPVVDGVPEGWEKCSAFDAVEVLSGGTPKTSEGRFWDGEIPFYTPKDSWGSIYAIDTLKNLTAEGLASCNSKLYPKNTLFITARGTVGNLNLAQRPMAMNQSCYALRGKGNMSPLFLYLAMKDAVEVVKSKAVGSVFDAIVVDTFKQIPFLNPSSGIMDGFQSTIAPIFNQVEILMLQSIRLQAARDLLLPRLMSGELAV
ncbi:MAG: restriction endonuclease subunit S, partial [Hymenobacter sp.]